jgi:dTDP-4-amino-4,6-dideoxygalactose transaminase
VARLRAELDAAIARVLDSGWFVLGPEGEAFERELAQALGAREAVAVANGTDALHLALRARGIGPGDEVITTAISAAFSALAILHAGARPVFVDVDPRTLNIDPEAAARAVTGRTRALMPVHLYGHPADMDPLLALAREHDLFVIEDTAQAHGARYRGRPAGTVGDVGCYSFYPTKNLGAWGDAGAITTADGELAERVRLLRSHGEKPRYHHRVIGTTARLDALQAAILRTKLERLDEANDRRRHLGAMLREGLAGSAVELPAMPGPDGDHVYHLFVVRSSEREALRAHLTAHGVASAVHYPIPIHRTEAFAHLGLGPGSLPVAESLAERIVTLPLWPTMSDEQVEVVVDAVQSFRPQGARTRRFAPSVQEPMFSGRSS